MKLRTCDYKVPHTRPSWKYIFSTSISSPIIRSLHNSVCSYIKLLNSHQHPSITWLRSLQFAIFSILEASIHAVKIQNNHCLRLDIFSVNLNRQMLFLWPQGIRMSNIRFYSSCIGLQLVWGDLNLWIEYGRFKRWFIYLFIHLNKCWASTLATAGTIDAYERLKYFRHTMTAA